MKHLYSFFISLLIFQGTTREVYGVLSDFSVKTAVSAEQIAIDQSLTLQATLTYPSSYHPDINLMRSRLLTYAGLDEPPFTLTKEIAYPTQTSDKLVTQRFDFILSPQLSGEHFLTLHFIPFEPNSKEEKTVEIPSDVFTIQVTIPQVKFDLYSLIEPPMPMSQDLPVAISQANKREYLKNPSLWDQEAIKNGAFLKNKSFPWTPVVATLIVILVIFLVRILPSNIMKDKLDPLTREKINLEIKQELKNICVLKPNDPNEAASLITQADFLVRKYLDHNYQFPAFSLTTQELTNQTKALADLTPSLQDEIVQIFKKADQIKFANYSPSPEECLGIKKTLITWIIFTM